MNIAATDYSLVYKSFDIYVSGCSASPKCTNCHNSEIWKFDIGTLYTTEYFITIKKKIKMFDDMVDNIMIFGGDPMDQDYGELRYMLSNLKSLNKPIWVFTRYDIMSIPHDIMQQCDYIKTGRYIPELTVSDNIQYGIRLATSNQKIYKISEYMFGQ